MGLRVNNVVKVLPLHKYKEIKTSPKVQALLFRYVNVQVHRNTYTRGLPAPGSWLINRRIAGASNGPSDKRQIQGQTDSGPCTPCTSRSSLPFFAMLLAIPCVMGSDDYAKHNNAMALFVLIC